MRFKEDREEAKDNSDHKLEVESLVQQLHSSDVSEAAKAAEAIYMMTSFASAVCIDDRSAMTSYDLSVFGGDPAPPPEGGDDGLGDVHVDGKRYGMGDGFMLSCDEGEDGAAKGKDWRRVAVSHSRSCIDNRVLIGETGGVFEGLVKVLSTGTTEGALQASRALSQMAFRNANNKRAFGETPGAMRALGGVVQRAFVAHEKRALAEACRAMGVLVAGDPANQEQVGTDSELVAALRRALERGDEESSGQAGRILNSVMHILTRDDATP